METQKIINLLNDSSNEESKFATKKWYVIDSQTTKGKYKQGDTIKFETGTIKSSLCDYSDAFILVTGNVTVAANNDTDVAFKNCAPFSTCKAVINDVFADKVDHIDVAMSMYNLIEFSHNYSDTSGSLLEFKRDEVRANNADLTIDDSESFKYKGALVEKTSNHNNGKISLKDTKIVVPLKYLSNFWRSLELPLINLKVHLELNWIEDCTLSSDGNSSKFEITDAKLHVPIVTLSTKDSVNLTKQLSEGFKRSVYWNSYQIKPAKVIEKGKNLYKLLNASFQGVRRLFVLAYVVAAGAASYEAGMKDNRKYFLLRGEIENYNVLIDVGNFYDQPINDLIKRYDDARKVSTGYGDDCTSGSLLDDEYFKNNYRVIAVDLSKEKALDADPRAIQQIVFQGVVGGDDNTKIRLYTILEQSKGTVLEF